ncbi:hypothetical protein ELQ90_07375 [Labedella phragmitis]|uniref:Fe-S oxidoreductase n=1 Tax=Labedella phragmitis TaxID=2498849 RepID=A0A444PVI7_9MICO|nr:hypothetical protein [Labedella phragmitis]RWZ51896.1 hypothetical protein ELQ90_07375 [Labedella phragmitis]
MRLGTRWSVGATPPDAVPTELVDRVRLAEAALVREAADQTWTLTWLEGRPIATLDDGTTVTLDDAATSAGAEESDDDW